MQLLIDSTKLEALLQRKQEYIGYKRLDQSCNVANALLVVYGGFSAPSEVAIWMKVMAVVFGGFGAYWSGCAMWKAMKNTYNADLLQHDITNLNEIQHPFSIVAIKDTFNEYPHRYLLYYDNRWQLNLFPNYRTQATEEANIANIISHLSNELQVPAQDIIVEQKGYKLTTKYSVSDKVQKVYAHTLYQATITKLPTQLQADSFTIGDRKYSWWSIDNMEADAGIREHNLDVVDLVKHNIV